QLSQFEKEKIPIVEDLLLESNPKKVENQILVDARMLKKRIKKDTSSIFSTIGLGPGFTAGENCMIAVETKRGHNMGRIIYIGPTSDNTGNPGEISGFSHQRVLYSKSEGKIIWTVQIGSIVNKNDIIGVQNGEPIHAKIGGKVRGLISPEVYVPFGIKIADIDPRGDEVDHRLISDKANAIARAVLEVVVRLRIDLERKSKRIEHGNENT
ncbi:MAG: hypothetical protein ACE5D7_09510, partial [Fidelibacterota bacterium]